MRAQVQSFIVVAVLFVLAFTLIMLGRLFPSLFAEIFDTTTVVLVVLLLPILIILVMQHQRLNQSQELPSSSAAPERSAQKPAAKSMPVQSETMTILESVPTELQAAILVSQLKDAGIDAWPEGGICSGFRAEAPGNVNVVVRLADSSRARGVLHQGRSAPAPTSQTPVPKHHSRRSVFVVVAWLLLTLILLGVVVL